MGVGLISVIAAAAWVSVVLIVIALCRAAAHADASSDRLIAH
jgi:hypothetical protein